MKIYKLSQIWNEERPAECTGYDGRDLGSLPLYQYSAIEADQFRLLHLRPGAGRDQIHFELKPAERRDALEYEAVSYCWGEVVPSCNIVCNGTRLPVTKNGIDALWHFRLPNKSRVLWMDAICINQGNDNEKSEQVTAMGDIYSTAKRALAWAGNEARFDKDAFALLADLLSTVNNDIVRQVKATTLYKTNLRLKTAIDRTPDGTDDWVAWSYLYYCMLNVFEEGAELKGTWKPPIALDNGVARNYMQKIDFNTGLAIRKLCDREYFYRCWVLQELALSKRLILYVGRNEMPWDDFAAMISLISRNTKAIPGLQQAASSLTQMEWWRTSGHLYANGAGQNSVLTIYLLNSGLRATKEIDRIYVMRNLGTEESKKAIRVDYGQDPLETYLQVGQGMLHGSAKEKAINISVVLPFLRFTPKQQTAGLPSWVPDFEALAAADLNMLALYARYRAGGELEHLESAYLHPANNKVLCLQGVVTDTIGSFAGLDPVPFHDFGVELFEFKNEAGYTLGYAIPSWDDFLYMISNHLPKSPTENEDVQAVILNKLRRMLSDAVLRLQAARDFVGQTTDEDVFWRATMAEIIPGRHWGMVRAPRDKPFPGFDAKLFLDALPSLAEPSNWIHGHPVLECLSKADLAKAYEFLMNMESWRDARFGRTRKGRLAWTPAKSKLGDSICLFGASGTFHVIRADGKGRWKIIGPAYVQGLMDGEAAQFNDDDFLYIS